MKKELFDLGFGGVLFTYEFDLPCFPEKTIYLLIMETQFKKEVVYVGKSENNFFNRIHSHTINYSKHFNRVFAFNIEPESIGYSLGEIEHAFISYYQPRHNIISKQDYKQKDFDIMSEFLRIHQDILDEQEVVHDLRS
ncbi:MAG: hypothetical protein KAS32_27370 [Candidatus Peribacteraceae bacterium]|nr:hypothetical protein [Candidatus Peribacteraceae bacterium]